MKIKEIREMSAEQLAEKLMELKKDLFTDSITWFIINTNHYSKFELIKSNAEDKRSK